MAFSTLPALRLRTHLCRTRRWDINRTWPPCTPCKIGRCAKIALILFRWRGNRRPSGVDTELMHATLCDATPQHHAAQAAAANGHEFNPPIPRDPNAVGPQPYHQLSHPYHQNVFMHVGPTNRVWRAVRRCQSSNIFVPDSGKAAVGVDADVGGLSTRQTNRLSIPGPRFRALLLRSGRSWARSRRRGNIQPLPLM